MSKILLLIISFLAIGCIKKNKPKYEIDQGVISSSLSILDSLLLYSTWSNQVILKNIKSNKIVFKAQTHDKCYAQPVLIGKNVYFPLSDSVFACINVLTSNVVWKARLGGRCSSFFIKNNTIIANSKNYGIMGLDLITGKLKYELCYEYNDKCSLPDISPYSMSSDSSSFYVCDWQCNSISAYNILDGKNIWAKKGDSAIGNVTYLNGVLFWGINKFYKGGHIALLNPKDGKVLFEIPSNFEERFYPIVCNNKIYYYTYDEKFNEFDVKLKSNRIVYTFNENNSVSGHQMFLLNANLYYSSQGKVFKLSLKDFTNKVVINDIKDIYGVYQHKGKLHFVY